MLSLRPQEKNVTVELLGWIVIVSRLYFLKYVFHKPRNTPTKGELSNLMYHQLLSFSFSVKQILKNLNVQHERKSENPGLCSCVAPKTLSEPVNAGEINIFSNNQDEGQAN